MDGTTEKRLACLLALGLGLFIVWLIATDPATTVPDTHAGAVQTPGPAGTRLIGPDVGSAW